MHLATASLQPLLRELFICREIHSIKHLCSQEHRISGESEKSLTNACNDVVHRVFPIVTEGLCSYTGVSDLYSVVLKSLRSDWMIGLKDWAEIGTWPLSLLTQHSLGSQDSTPHTRQAQLILKMKQQFRSDKRS